MEDFFKVRREPCLEFEWCWSFIDLLCLLGIFATQVVIITISNITGGQILSNLVILLKDHKTGCIYDQEKSNISLTYNCSLISWCCYWCRWCCRCWWQLMLLWRSTGDLIWDSAFRALVPCALCLRKWVFFTCHFFGRSIAAWLFLSFNSVGAGACTCGLGLSLFGLLQ